MPEKSSTDAKITQETEQPAPKPEAAEDGEDASETGKAIEPSNESQQTTEQRNNETTQATETKVRSEMNGQKEELETGIVEGSKNDEESDNANNTDENGTKESEKKVQSEVNEGEEVTVTDGDGQTANGKPNNNNNNSNLILDNKASLTGINEIKEEPELLDFSSGPLLAQDPFKEEINSEMRVSDIFQQLQVDSSVSSRAKNSHDMKEAEQEQPTTKTLVCTETDDNPKFSASRFLDDTFAGFDDSSNLFPEFKDVIYSKESASSQLDELLDFGIESIGEMGQNTEAEMKKNPLEKNDTKDAGLLSEASSLWQHENDFLSVEDQIKQNRYYDDD
ncbi:hypothetical protein cypCar_00025316 [Cyprinus carpio]|nr:hypothetical protein cypCar_00025316 [Cyprinus carpio]